MKKRGFTLIELLSVVVVLAIIALIAVPIILNVIDEAKKNAFKDTAYGLIESAEFYYSKNQLLDRNIEEKTFTFPDVSELGYKGEVPQSGTLVINKRGQVSLMISNGKYCITKDYDNVEVALSKDLGKCSTAPVEPDYTDNSGANRPDLLTNMIPVKYNGTNWVYVDTTQEWYNYNDKEWANAVVLNSGVTRSVGNPISESDVALWYVWIPRYKYKLFNANNTSKTEQLIEIEFESGIEKTGTVTCQISTTGVETCKNASNGNWYTHPAFTLGNQELTGIWIGKFESSTSDTSCNNNPSEANCNKELPVTVKPNVSSWKYASVSTFYHSMRKMTDTYSISNGDSHMIKNMEWGAVAYLKQSKYGLGMTDIALNTNSSYIASGGTSNNYKKNASQSTTGNITGIYDMSGGTYEYVMGNMVDSNGTFYSSGAGFTNAPDRKYYDVYSYDTVETSHARGHLGDATREVLKTYGSNRGGWYSDYSYLPHSTSSWCDRGGRYSDGSYAGMFYHGRNDGRATSFTTTRAVLTRNEI